MLAAGLGQVSSSRYFVMFEADLPNDAIFAASGDISVPGGRNVGEAFVKALRSRAISASDPKQCEFYGWEITANVNGVELWMLLQGLENWLLIVEDGSGKKSWFGKAKEPPLGTLQMIDDVIKQCPMFSSISWFTRKEFEAGKQAGSPSP